MGSLMLFSQWNPSRMERVGGLLVPITHHGIHESEQCLFESNYNLPLKNGISQYSSKV